ncbi:hypothetical protein APY04_0770 [Hyphomicrobium sulfonivorans]|uniref:Uncharacterized protein n=1 Tax=Hyphomicrobium sulfonivorans TaxID=121290 RepID=A0A120CXC2_HYPSL|nr:hypothetical protein [Hyphomicrobium sulfonivorans]KWT70709.1 hypothetical protein APY04_0770 [Hyphomicrobium sulfonivorans]
MSKPSLSEQRSGVEALICFAKDADISSSVIDAARGALLTLKWLEARSALVKEIVRLDQHAPAIAIALRELPDAQITGVR